MKASNTFEGEFLDHLFLNGALPGIGNANGLQPAETAGYFYLRLCTDAVTIDDSTVGTECTYTGYVTGGIAIPRTATGFIRSANELSNAAEIIFGACTNGTENIKYAELWRDNVNSNEAYRLTWMEFNPVKPVTAGVTPRFVAGNLKFTFD